MGYVAGDVEIKRLELVSEDGCRSTDLRGKAVVLDVFESILSPTVYAEVQINDGVGLRTGFPIVGEEHVVLEFSSPNTGCTSKYELFVNELVDQTTSDNNRMEHYTLRCVSREVVLNSTKQCNRKFKTEASSIVEDLYSELGTDRELVYVEPTRGIEEVVVTKMTPMKTIDMVRRRATSRSYLSSSFVFFENSRGHQFTTIEGLFARNRDSIGDRVFFFDKKPNVDATTVDYRNIIAYQHVASGSTVSKLQNGAFTSVVNRLDLMTGQYTTIPYTLNAANDKFQTADGAGAPGLNSSSFINARKKEASVSMVVPFSSERNDTQTAEKLATQRSFVELISSDLTRIYVYGDSQVMAGDVIQCNFPEVTGLTKDPKLNRMHSGKYLVSGLRHMITVGDRYQHTMSLELIKGDYLEA